MYCIIIQAALGCDTSVLKDLVTPDGYKFLCQVSSDAEGRFVFGSVPCGQYLLVRWTALLCFIVNMLLVNSVIRC